MTNRYLAEYNEPAMALAQQLSRPLFAVNSGFQLLITMKSTTEVISAALVIRRIFIGHRPTARPEADVLRNKACRWHSFLHSVGRRIATS